MLNDYNNTTTTTTTTTNNNCNVVDQPNRTERYVIVCVYLSVCPSVTKHEHEMNQNNIQFYVHLLACDHHHHPRSQQPPLIVPLPTQNQKHTTLLSV